MESLIIFLWNICLALPYLFKLTVLVYMCACEFLNSNQRKSELLIRQVLDVT